jgi:Protein of unknown function (DUF2637)
MHKLAIAEGLTRDGIPSPSAHDPARNSHRVGVTWPKGAVRAIVFGVVAVAVVVSYEHASALVRVHGESGWPGRLISLTVDGLVCASSMAMLDAARRGIRLRCSPGGCWALASRRRSRRTWLTAWARARVGAVVGAWPAVALVGSYELLMVIIRSAQMPADAAAASEVTDTAPGDGPVQARPRGRSRMRSPLGACRRCGRSGPGCMSGSRGRDAYAPPWLCWPTLSQMAIYSARVTADLALIPVAWLRRFATGRWGVIWTPPPVGRANGRLLVPMSGTSFCPSAGKTRCEWSASSV